MTDTISGCHRARTVWSKSPTTPPSSYHLSTAFTTPGGNRPPRPTLPRIRDPSGHCRRSAYPLRRLFLAPTPLRVTLRTTGPSTTTKRQSPATPATSLRPFRPILFSTGQAQPLPEPARGRNLPGRPRLPRPVYRIATDPPHHPTSVASLFPTTNLPEGRYLPPLTAPGMA